MAEQKTKPTDQKVEDFLQTVDDEKKRDDCYRIMTLMQEVTGEEPRMWGPSIVGFGQYHYKYASGHEGDACLTGFSPRKKEITLYLMPGFVQLEESLAKLGRFKAGKGCLYLKKLDDVDQEVLKDLIRESVRHLRELYP